MASARLSRRLLLAVWALVGGVGCAQPGSPSAREPVRPPSFVRDLPLRPPTAVITREGDPQAALAVAILTAGVDDAAGAWVPVALAAATEARLASQGLTGVTILPAWDGYRVRVSLPALDDADRILGALRAALVSPLSPDGPDTAAALKKLETFARRPVREPALVDLARCAAEPISTAPADAPPPTPGTLERWRAAAQGLGRVVFGVVGAPAAVDRLTSAMLRQPEWPAAMAPWPATLLEPAADARYVYDASGDVQAGRARVRVLLRTGDAMTAVSAAPVLADRDGALSLRLRAVDPAAVLRDVTATAQLGGGCLALTVDVSGVDPRSEADPAGPLAAVSAVLAQEARRSVTSMERGGSPLTASVLAEGPREAAELAAWWGLLGWGGFRGPERLAVDALVGLPAGGDPAADFSLRARGVEGAIDRATSAWQGRVVEARTAVERGQGALWVLVGSPCGTLPEGESDAGLSAVAVSAMVEQARGAARLRGVELSEWVASDGVGLVARGSRRDGESASALARRVADVAAEAFSAGSLGASAIGRVRTALLAAGGQDDASASFASLAHAVTPGHASWTFPTIPGGLGAWSDAAVSSRATSMRRGPVRVAVIGNEDDAQTDAAVEAVDRWVVRSSAGQATCPALTALPAPRPGTYPGAAATSSSAWIALPLFGATASSATADIAATVAAALDGPDGLLTRALSSGLAVESSVRVVGPREAPTLVVHVTSSPRTLDDAVMQVRALLDRLHRGAFTDADRNRAATRLGAVAVASSMDPRGRLARLWRGGSAAPSAAPTDAVQRWLGEVLRDDALIFVSSRPAP